MRYGFFIGIVLAVLLVMVSTLRFVTAVYGVSVDDAYIFFVYARNLAEGHGWSFNPGETSFGTSSPLWTVILAATAWAGADLIHASRILGGLFYAAGTVLAILIFHELTGSRVWALLAGMVMAGTGNLLLIALSGMEVTLHAFLLLLLVYVVARWGIDKPLWIGGILGLAFLSRPDAVIAGPILAASWLLVGVTSRAKPAHLLQQSWRQWLIIAASALVVIAPWVIFVYAHTGKILPTTHYAKLLSMPGAPETLDDTLIERTTRALGYAYEGLRWILTTHGIFVSVLLVGIALLWLIARLVNYFDARVQDETPRHHLTAQWVMVGLLVLLPLEYGWQTPWWYGGYLSRYILPVLPLALLLSFLGGYRLLVAIGLYPNPTTVDKSPVNIARSRAGYGLVAVLALLILARTVSYQQVLDALIRDYQVIVAHNEAYRRAVGEWIATNTPLDTRVGETHLGVGAIGYYADRHIVDAGGLVDGKIIDYWAQDGDPQFSAAETLHFFEATGVDIVVGPPGMDKNPDWPLAAVTQIDNPTGDLSWAGTGFNQVVLYRPR